MWSVAGSFQECFSGSQALAALLLVIFSNLWGNSYPFAPSMNLFCELCSLAHSPALASNHSPLHMHFLVSHWGWIQHLDHIFPRASERRVLPIVGVCISSSHLHTFSSSHLLSHLLIFTSAHLHICSSSNLLIFTSAHLHICSSSHLHILTSPSHLHICSSSHLFIFTSAHLHICSSSHLLIFTSSHLHICSSSHLLIFTSAHLHIFTYSHLHFLSLALTSSHTHIFSLSLSLSLSLSPSSFLSPFSPSLLSLLFLSLAFFIFLSLGRGWCRRGVTKRQPFRTK